MVVLFVILEEYFYGLEYKPSFDLLLRLVPIYFIFIGLVNAGTDRQTYLRILRLSWVLILFNTTIFYLAILGVINVFELEQSELTRRLTATTNMNYFSDMNILGIFLTVLLKLEGIPLKVFNIKVRIEIVILYFIFLVLLNATRGSVIILLLLLIVYILYVWGKLSPRGKIGLILFLFFLLVVILSTEQIESILIRLRIGERFVQQNISEEGVWFQMIGSVANFLKSPIIGVGYEQASSAEEGFTTSNFQYSQILGGNGLIFFIVFYLFNFRMFGASIKRLITNPILLSFFLFIFTAYIFRQADSYFAVIAYLVYYYKYFSAKNTSFKKSFNLNK
ncbi:MAG: hypothetical protein WC644_01425 [Ignavibacteria bacterium]